ncbi:transposase [Simiduia litorea]|uniref:transposase n=1 Tax=Simiduia litorea TaxID=1435348 RepID=UPI0036F27FA7
MARLPRLYVLGCSHHIIQRGNNRDACFFDERDYAFYLQQLQQSAKQFNVAVHAFVLMTNHVHLLVTPTTADGCSKMMQSLGRKYVRYINISYQRSGTLWEGQYKSTLVDSELYFLTVSRYIELNPVRAGMVEAPGDYPWSSFRANGMGKSIQLLTQHSCYRALGRTDAQRVLRYRSLFSDTIHTELLDAIRECANKSWVLGSDKFKSQIAVHANRRVESCGWGGDRKSLALREDQGV